MLQFLLAIPEIVLYGCVILIAVAIVMSIALLRQIRRVGSQVGVLTNALNSVSAGTGYLSPRSMKFGEGSSEPLRESRRSAQRVEDGG
jgi:hypothetical protein